MASFRRLSVALSAFPVFWTLVAVVGLKSTRTLLSPLKEFIPPMALSPFCLAYTPQEKRLRLFPYLRMLYGNRNTLLRYVEHVEDHGLVASVLAVVDGADHFDDRLAGLDGLLLAV